MQKENLEHRDKRDLTMCKIKISINLPLTNLFIFREDEKEAAENKYLGGTLQFVDMLEDGDIGKFIRSKFSATDSYDVLERFHFND